MEKHGKTRSMFQTTNQPIYGWFSHWNLHLHGISQLAMFDYRRVSLSMFPSLANKDISSSWAGAGVPSKSYFATQISSWPQPRRWKIFNLLLDLFSDVSMFHGLWDEFVEQIASDKKTSWAVTNQDRRPGGTILVSGAAVSMDTHITSGMTSCPVIQHEGKKSLNFHDFRIKTYFEFRDVQSSHLWFLANLISPTKPPCILWKSLENPHTWYNVGPPNL